MLLSDELSASNFVNDQSLQSPIHDTLPGWLERCFGGNDRKLVDAALVSAMEHANMYRDDAEFENSDHAFADCTSEQLHEIWYEAVLPVVRGA